MRAIDEQDYYARSAGDRARKERSLEQRLGELEESSRASHERVMTRLREIEEQLRGIEAALPSSKDSGAK